MIRPSAVYWSYRCDLLIVLQCVKQRDNQKCISAVHVYIKKQERGIISPWFIIMHPHIIFEFINHHQIHKYWFIYLGKTCRENDFHIDNSYNDYATFRWFLIFDIYHSHYHGTPLCTDDSSRCLSSLTVHYHWLSDKIPTKN